MTGKPENPPAVRVDDSFLWGNSAVRVIAVDRSRKWLMVRRKGCRPFVIFASAVSQMLSEREKRDAE